MAERKIWKILKENDLGLLLEELLDVRTKWYNLGLLLNLTVSTQDRIKTQFTDPRDQLLEMLKTWLTTGYNYSWKTLTDALRNRNVGESQLADDLEAKYYLVEDTHETAQSPGITDLSQVDSTPLGKILTLDDLGLLLEELLDKQHDWYHLGLQLKLNFGKLDWIREQFSDPRDQLLEMLGFWLRTAEKPSWKTLTDALRSRNVGENQLADHLEAKYCLVEDTLESAQSLGTTDPSQVDSTPLGKILTLDGLRLLQEELLDVKWYHLGLQLNLRVNKLDGIRTQFHNPRDQLLEMLKTWLTTADNPSWKSLTDALRSRTVGANQLADHLEAKYGLVEDTLEAAQTPHGITDHSQVDSTPLENGLTLDDLGLVLEELLDVHAKWYSLGVQLKVRTETLDNISQRFSDYTLRLLEVLKVWLTTAVNPSWNTLIDALRNVHASQLADDLDTKYCSMKDMKETEQSPGTTDPSQVDSTPSGNVLTSDDLRLLLEELVDVLILFYPLGLQLKVGTEALDSIQAQFSDPTLQLREMLKVWLTTAYKPSWKTLTDGLRSRSVGESQLADDLKAKYCRPKDMRETPQSPPGITDPSQVDFTPLGNKLTSDDLGLLLEELLDVHEEWYPLGLLLKVRTEILEWIRTQFLDSRHQLQEMLKFCLTTADKPSWKTLTDALRSRSVGATQLASVLKAKYCLVEDKQETAQSPPGITDPSQVDSAQLGSMLTSDDLDLLVYELLDASAQWYPLGLQLKVKTKTLERISVCFSDPRDQLWEMLKVWLITADNPSWKILTDALRSRSVGASLLAGVLKAKYCLVEDIEAQLSASTETQLIPLSQQGEPQMKAQQAQGQIGYQTVQLLRTEPLGTGSYGAVYKAMLEDLPCAGKILHPTLFQSNDPGATTIMSQFQQECNFLSAIRHPNIVLYLGSCQDRGTGMPVLLMELMDDNLTRFLEQSEESLPYHIQVNVCHDIALALAYLHSNDIIHRDLSSNNVLLIGGGNRVKVTDFGMAKVFNINRTTMTPLTMCPGTLPYMSPEALEDPPVYTKKLDTFSFGVLGIQIVTRQFPDPSPRMKKVRDPRFPVGIQVPVLDIERRKSHIDLIDPTNPLLSIATKCLNYNEEDRPSAQELCHRLAALKGVQQYRDSVQQAQERSRELQQQQKQIQDLQQQLQVRDDQVREKDSVIATREQKIQQLEQATREKDYHIDAREKQLREFNKKLEASEQVTAQSQLNLLQREETIQELEEKLHLRQELDRVLQQQIMTQKGSIQGVEVVGEAEFTVSAEGGSFQWEGYGLKLHVSKDSLSPGKAECRINIKVSLSGQFQLPEGSDLLSPVFWISAPCKFTKPVTLEIQHCALTEDETVLSKLSFVSAICSQMDLPYRFTQVDGGVFTTNSTYGSIQLNHFSGVGVTGRKGTPRSYCAHVYHTKKKDYEWRFYFVIIQDLDAKNTVVREHYGHFADQEATFRVRFERSKITLGISADGLVTKEGWRITPFTAPTITREDVDQFKKGQWIPECQLVVQWEKEDHEKPVQLRHKVYLTGAKPPYNFINLILNPAGQAPPHHPGKLHSTPELGDLMNLVAAKIPEKWREVGIGLGLDSADIRHIEADVPTHKSTPCYVMVFDTWKNKGTKEYTWDILLKALRTPSVNASELASTIEGQL